MCVYLLHFDEPYTSPNGAKTIAHYIGYASRLERRLAHHENGTGARVLAVVRDAGITWRCVRTWPEGDRTLERRLKNHKHHADYCPVCRETAAARSQEGR